ncbi:MAG TPA: 5'-nucleotidase C-terminal domain-containing protein, partial [Ilumatobacteraceae bacterium]|nr:5'-nucleotidase C-terminal domain-containing protein [Ilumatobacteraceae bacterium]
YIPNGDDSTADMAHPTRTGDVVAFSYPPYQFDAATPGTLIARSAFFGQHGYVPDIQDLKSNTNMRATFLAGGKAIEHGVVDNVRSIDLAPTAAFLLDIPVPEQSQGQVLLDLLDDGHKYTPVNLVGLTDFHGQLEAATTSIVGRNTLAGEVATLSVGGAAQLATMFEEEALQLPGDSLLVASGDNVGASPAISSLLEDAPTIDVENLWGLDATAYGNHEFDYGRPRIEAHQARADFPFLSSNIVDETTGELPDWLDETSAVFTVNGVQVGVIGSTVKTTPELVKAEATAGLLFLDEAERIRLESQKLEAMGVNVQVVVIHEGAASGGANAVDGRPAVPYGGPIIDIVTQLEDTTIDLVFAGHTHRIANTVVAGIPVLEGANAGASYSVAQLVVRGDDVAWASGSTRVAKNIGVAKRPDVQAVVDAANAATAVLRNQVIGTQQIDIRRAPSRLLESAMGNMVADAMLIKYPGLDAALTNSGGLRQDLLIAPPSAGEQPGEITWGEVFGVLPFSNRTAIMSLTGAQLREALLNGFSPVCNPAIATGRFPQVSGLRTSFRCNGTTPEIVTLTRSDGITPIDPAETIRIVTNDFMLTGGDGYTVLTQGTDVLQPGDDLMNVVIEYIAANSPPGVAPVVEGRIVNATPPPP